MLCSHFVSIFINSYYTISVLCCGQMALQVHNGSEWTDTSIYKVLLAADLRTNLFTVYRVSNKGYIMMTEDSSQLYVFYPLKMKWAKLQEHDKQYNKREVRKISVSKQ